MLLGNGCVVKRSYSAQMYPSPGNTIWTGQNAKFIAMGHLCSSRDDILSFYFIEIKVQTFRVIAASVRHSAIIGVVGSQIRQYCDGSPLGSVPFMQVPCAVEMVSMSSKRT